MSTLDAKLTNNCDEKLQEIDWEISQAKIDLENFKNANNPYFQAKIEELETKLKKLEEEKQKIISETQSCLSWEKIDRTQLAKAQENVAKSDLSSEQKAQVSQALNEQKNSGDFDFSNIENWWIVWIIIALLQAVLWWHGILWWENEYEEANETETPWKIIKWKEKTPKDKQNFIAQYKDIAKQMESEFKIPWEFIITQAWLESNWWTSGLAVNYNNLFGIKARKWWKSVMLWTKEEINGKMVRKKEPFRVYDSIEESFRDHAKFLIENKRYANAFNYPDDPVKFALEVAKAWYATDSQYASKLTSTMKWVA